MQKLFLSFLVVILLVGIIQAQETIGPRAEAARKEILKLEDEKVAGLLRGGSEPADWLQRYDTEHIVNMRPDGSTNTKVELVTEMRKGNLKVITMKQHDHQIFIYNDGTIAVVTNLADGTIQRNSGVSEVHNRFTDVWFKQSGEWRRIVHDVANIPHPRPGP